MEEAMNMAETMEEALNTAKNMEDIMSKDEFGDWVVKEVSPHLEDNGEIVMAIALLLLGTMLTFKGARWFQSLLFGVCLHCHTRYCILINLIL